VSSAQETVSVNGPALVGGAAALAGLAGAVALALNGRGKGQSFSDAVKKRRRKATRKALGVTTKALGKTAVEVGKAGYRVGELTAEVRRVREQASQKN
jgi:hypothetical protein